MNSRTIWTRPDLRTRLIETSLGAVEFLEGGSGSPVLYFHGTGATGEVVAVTERALVDDGFRLIVPHRPGYHGTPITSGRTPQVCADLGAALLDRLGVAKVGVIGTSGGGPAAIHFAARHSARTAALVLQCAVCHPYSARRWMSRRMRILPGWLRTRPLGLSIVRSGFRRAIRRFQRDPGHLAREMSGKRYADIRHDAATNELAALFVDTLIDCAGLPGGMENDWSISVGRPWLTANSIDAPTLIFHDRADPLVPFTHAEWAAQTIPRAQLCELHVGGHLIWLGPDAARMSTERAAFLRQHLTAPTCDSPAT